MQSLAALALLVVVIIAGIIQWKRGQGHEEYADSALNVQIEWVSGGAYMMEHYAQRISGPADVLSQLFLSGPVRLIKGISNSGRFSNQMQHSRRGWWICWNRCG